MSSSIAAITTGASSVVITASGTDVILNLLSGTTMALAVTLTGANVTETPTTADTLVGKALAEYNSAELGVIEVAVGRS